MDQPGRHIQATEYRTTGATPVPPAAPLTTPQRVGLLLLVTALGGLALAHGLMVVGLVRVHPAFQILLWVLGGLLIGGLGWQVIQLLHPWRSAYRQISEGCSYLVQETDGPDQLVEHLLRLVESALGVDRIALWRYDEADSLLLMWHSTGPAPAGDLSELPLDLPPRRLRGCWPIATLPESAVKQALAATGAAWLVELRLGSRVIGFLTLGQLPKKLAHVPNIPAWLSLVGGQIAPVAGTVLLAAELYESQQQLHQAYRRTIDVQEKERQSLATELHDDILGRLTTMALTLRRSQSRLTDDPPQVKDWLESLEAETQSINRRLREITQGLHPSVLIDLGLISALQAYLDSLARQPLPASAPHTVSLTAQGFGRMRLAEEKLERDLYYITRQALDNAIKHARAPQIFIHLRWDREAISVTVRDTGCGMADSPEQLMGHNGRLGLLSMHERALAWRGQLIFHSAPDQGTTVRARLPLEQASPAPAHLQAFTHYLRPRPDEATPADVILSEANASEKSAAALQILE